MVTVHLRKLDNAYVVETEFDGKVNNNASLIFSTRKEATAELKRRQAVLDEQDKIMGRIPPLPKGKPTGFLLIK